VVALTAATQSALPDIMLCFVVFDTLVAIQNEDFKKFMHLDFVKDAVVGVYVVFLIINVVPWFIAVTELEHRLLLCHQTSTSSMGSGYYLSPECSLRSYS
jgi:hypothetical protein